MPITVLPSPYTGPGGGHESLPHDIVIRVNGVEIQDDVRYADAVFRSAVNGTTGECSFSVRDLDHTRGFTNGHEIEVEIGGVLYWAGFVMKVRRQYSFPVDDTTDPQATERWFLIQGYDVNWLLQKRVAWNIAHPTKVMTPPSGSADPDAPDMWKAGVTSDSVIKYVIAHYTTLTADGVTTTEVKNIGSPNPDAAGAYGGGITVAAFLDLVNSVLNGVYYLRPNRSLVSRDVEVATTPYYLSDHPTGAYGVGPREYVITSDGTNMINDALIWGTAKGVDFITFSREEAAPSITEHGRWQYGEFSPSLYKQASVDHRADAIVNGNAPTRHGAKEDRVVVEATVFDPIFQLGDVVTCHQRVFDGTQTAPFDTAPSYVRINLPVRTMEITFPTERNPQFKMILSQELDVPWNTYEFFFPRFDFDVDLPPLPPLPPVQGGCPDGTSDCIGGFALDDFEGRTNVGYWDQSSTGTNWIEEAIPYPENQISVSGGQGHIDLASNESRGVETQNLSPSPMSTGEFEFRTSFEYDTAFSASGESLQIRFRAINQSNRPADDFVAYIELSNDPDHTWISAGDGVAGAPIDVAPAPGTTIHFAWLVQGGTAKAKVWWGGAEPDWMVECFAPSHPWNRLQVFVDGTDWSPDYYAARISFDEFTFGGGDSGCFDAALTDWWSGTFTFLSDESGYSDGSGDTIYSSNTDTPSFPPGDYTFAIGMIVAHAVPCGDQDTGHQAGLQPVGQPGLWITPHASDNPSVGLNLLGFGGTFTVHDDGFGNGYGPVTVAAGVGAGCHIHKTVNVTFAFNPVDWVRPTPAPCQTVTDVPIAGLNDSTGTVFQTRFAYVPGSLRVFVTTDGVETEIFTFTETNPALGIFTLDAPLLEGQTIRVTYLYAGNTPQPSTFYGDLCESLVQVSSTVWRSTYRIQDGTARIWDTGYLLLPGIARDYTVSGNTVTFAVPPTSTPWICYTANGAP